MNIAIIPARGGSKRIPRKNIKEFCGKPMIAYAINAARKSGLFQHIIVSTDDEEIAKIAIKYGAEVPFIRTADLSNDHVATIPVIAHAIQECKKFGWKFDFVCCIYPCAPFIKTEDLKDSFSLLNSSYSDRNYCFPITEFPSAIQRGFELLEGNKIQPLFPKFELQRTQDINPTYYDVGQFYWGKIDAWLSSSKIHSNGLGFIIPNWRVVDIDTPDDWKRAEMLAQSLENLI